MAETVDKWPSGGLDIDELRALSKIVNEYNDGIDEPDPVFERGARKMQAAVDLHDEENRPIKTDYTREELIALCEDAIRPQDKWHDRDSESAQRNVAQAWALLKAGCDFRVGDGSDELCATDHKTVWVEIVSEGFMFHETREQGDLKKDTFYIPTREQLDKSGDGDWY